MIIFFKLTEISHIPLMFSLLITYCIIKNLYILNNQCFIIFIFEHFFLCGTLWLLRETLCNSYFTKLLKEDTE